jgi:type I restriction enzyme R subunit
MDDAQLAVIVREIIACELIQVVRILTSKNTRKNVSIDWTVKERARIRIVVKRILREYDYPPNLLCVKQDDIMR